MGRVRRVSESEAWRTAGALTVFQIVPVPAASSSDRRAKARALHCGLTHSSVFLNSADFSVIPRSASSCLLRQLHAAELGAAHLRTVRDLARLGGRRLVVEGPRPVTGSMARLN